jgi:hypothetical protein
MNLAEDDNQEKNSVYNADASIILPKYYITWRTMGMIC